MWDFSSGVPIHYQVAVVLFFSKKIAFFFGLRRTGVSCLSLSQSEKPQEKNDRVSTFRVKCFLNNGAP